MTQHFPLHRLIYVSRFSAAFPSERQEQDYVTASIVRTSVRLNAESGLTGLLLVCRRHFAQVLEGSADAVEATFGRIQRDSRHTDIRLIQMARCDQRLFPDWTMSARRVDVGDGSFMGDLNLDGAADPSTLDAEGALSLLTAARNARTRVILAAMA